MILVGRSTVILKPAFGPRAPKRSLYLGDPTSLSAAQLGKFLRENDASPHDSFPGNSRRYYVDDSDLFLGFDRRSVLAVEPQRYSLMN
jgi:hypothetical protein